MVFCLQKEPKTMAMDCSMSTNTANCCLLYRGRDTLSCQQLWYRFPSDYQTCQTVSDAWHIYPEVIPKALHQVVGKETGETTHVEHWNNVLRQQIGRSVRKTLSFSKSDEYHYWMTLWFILDYNLQVASLTM